MNVLIDSATKRKNINKQSNSEKKVKNETYSEYLWRQQIISVAIFKCQKRH